MLKTFCYYVLCGLGATLAHYSTLFVMVDKLMLPIILSASIGHLVGAVVGFTLNGYVTFGMPDRQAVALTKYIGLAFVNNIANAALLTLILQSTKLHYLIAQAIVTIIIMVSNFFICKAWVYRRV